MSAPLQALKLYSVFSYILALAGIAKAYVRTDQVRNLTTVYIDDDHGLLGRLGDVD